MSRIKYIISGVLAYALVACTANAKQISQSRNNYLSSCNLIKIVHYDSILVECTHKPSKYMVHLLEKDTNIVSREWIYRHSELYKENYYFELKIFLKDTNKINSIDEIINSLQLLTQGVKVNPSMVHRESTMKITPYQNILIMFPFHKISISDLELNFIFDNRKFKFIFYKEEIICLLNKLIDQL